MSEQFEHKVHELLGDIQFEPGSDVWKRVQQQVQPEKKRRRFIFWWLLPFVLAGGALTYYFTIENNEQSIAKNDTSKTVSDKIETIPLQSSSSVLTGNTTTSQASNDNAGKKQEKILTSNPVSVYVKSNKLKQKQTSAARSKSSFNSPSVTTNTSTVNDQSKQSVAVTKTVQDGETTSIIKQTNELS